MGDKGAHTASAAGARPVCAHAESDTWDLGRTRHDCTGSAYAARYYKLWPPPLPPARVWGQERRRRDAKSGDPVHNCAGEMTIYLYKFVVGQVYVGTDNNVAKAECDASKSRSDRPCATTSLPPFWSFRHNNCRLRCVIAPGNHGPINYNNEHGQGRIYPRANQS